MIPENILSEYVDLSLARLSILQLANCKKLKQLNNVARKVMQDVLYDDLTLTPYGKTLLQRVKRLEAGKIPAPETFCNCDIDLMDTIKTARQLRKEFPWIRSVHLKLMRKLYKQPELAYQYLCMIYGQIEVHLLLDKGLILGERKLGSPFTLSGIGRNMLKKVLDG
jgi:hypothetical protein